MVLLDEIGNLQTYDKNLTTEYLFTLISRPQTLSCISTHYPNVPTLSIYYPNVINMHLESFINDENGSIKYSYKLKRGVNQSWFAYGIKKAHSFFIHPDIIENALMTLQKIDDVFSSITNPDGFK